MKEHLDRITVVLSHPLHPGNVGSVVRAMKNMGLSRLRLVQPCDHRAEIAEWMAVSAKEILHRAEVFVDLPAALAGCNLVVGTVPPDRPRFQGESRLPREMAKRLLTVHPDDRIALLFGTEDHGLSNEELDLCHEFVTIPSHPAFPSLNLSHAVMVIAYEIYAVDGGASGRADRSIADSVLQEQMFSQMEETLSRIGFLNRENPRHIMRDLRRIFGRAKLNDREVRILRGILRQVDWAVNDHG
ncbi:MAG: RNA methyltransferase [Deltaproteobacteria bacterium]|nr:RNA methyltransferase [Deltaproteobacteria bacterium]